ncbi:MULTISPECIES: N-formylglutamate amidohydrolase [Hydrocarboniphaga]|jgi:predicted N-formylglutamate amidohydrolase|uniref:N-formylglutamate amidohydrolase n=1 Tax=Hydrocarboniphaga effusa AP103 TaxID=1172194 RepID=I7ZDH5_9GAMM|nr:MULTISPECIES: N-formylglutamate amidohydrolase [Hydrocarboniphaga]EIT69762.1 hypothetical protein WQQ_33440 [Hydrocarboniphaga effusa AP103]MDZ4078856.1 N-formylglutamate amidohydrolase [Hydrocarboniphaga sp.]
MNKPADTIEATENRNRPRLLGADDPAPVWIENERGSSPFVLIADHAGNRVPSALNELGLPLHERERHIAWDIGVAGLAVALSRELDAACIGQTYSRLVIDCNRRPDAEDSIPHTSDGTRIPGNIGLAHEQIEVRRREIYTPYHQAITALLDPRSQRSTALVLLHSFTPVFGGITRRWHAGVLYNRDERLARPLLKALAEQTDFVIGDNEPYSAQDGTDVALIDHGEARGLPVVELEIRQDLISNASGQDLWARTLATALKSTGI